MAWGPIAGALIGGYFASQGSKRANRANQAINQQSEAFQRELAQNSVQYRVADAKAAGVSPYAALGMNAMSGSGASIPMQNEMSGLGNAFERAGNKILSPMQRKANELDLKYKGLQVDLLSAQVAAARLAVAKQTGEPEVNPFTGASLETRPAGALTDTLPSEVVSSIPGDDHVEAGTHPPLSFMRRADGALVPIKSKRMKEELEDDPIAQLGYHADRLLNPFRDTVPSKQYLPKGAIGFYRKTWSGPWYPYYHPSEVPWYAVTGKQLRRWR